MQDLSAFANGIFGGSSMAGGNTVSSVPAFSSAGIPSEGTADFPVRDAGPVLPPQEDYAQLVPGPDAHGAHGFDDAHATADAHTADVSGRYDQFAGLGERWKANR